MSVGRGGLVTLLSVVSSLKWLKLGTPYSTIMQSSTQEVSCWKLCFFANADSLLDKLYSSVCHINQDWCFFFWGGLQVSIVSVVYSQSDLLKKEVFLVELVDSISKSKEPMSHLKAIYFLRPTSENIQYLRRQLANPRFGEYHLCKCFIFSITS